MKVEKTFPGTHEKLIKYDKIDREYKVEIKNNRIIEFKGKKD